MTTSETGSSATSMIASRLAPSPGTPPPSAPADAAWSFPRRSRAWSSGWGGMARPSAGPAAARPAARPAAALPSPPGAPPGSPPGGAGPESPGGGGAGEAGPRGPPPGEWGAGGRHPARQPRGHLLVGAVLQQPREQQVPGLERGEILLVVDLPRRQQPRRLEVEQGGGDHEEIAGLIQVPSVRPGPDVADELVGDAGQRDLRDVQLVLRDQGEQQVEGALEDVKVHLEPSSRPGVARLSDHRHSGRTPSGDDPPRPPPRRLRPGRPPPPTPPPHSPSLKPQATTRPTPPPATVVHQTT